MSDRSEISVLSSATARSAVSVLSRDSARFAVLFYRLAAIGELAPRRAEAAVGVASPTPWIAMAAAATGQPL